MHLNQFAVIGSGTMGAQIAAHLVNAGFSVYLFDLKKDGINLADAGKARLLKTDPEPLASKSFMQFISPKNLEDDLECLKECDLIIEAVLEDLDLKEKLYNKIAPFLSQSAILASNTSGLSIEKLGSVLPKGLQSRFLGMHFFNPPRYLPLIELIPHSHTEPALLDALEIFLTSYLGKQVVRAKDTPNFIANRLGVFGLLATLYHAQSLDIPLEVVDQLTGKLLGRPKSATCRTMDLVGLDVLAHVVETMDRELIQDPWHEFYHLPEWLNGLIEKGALGAKTRKGIYEKTPEGLKVWDTAQNSYRLANQKANADFIKLLKDKKITGLWPSLQDNPLPEAQFLFRLFRDLFAYSAYHLDEISDSMTEVDRALRYGFGWNKGVFEIWQDTGWENVIKILEQDTGLAKVVLPAWIKNPADKAKASQHLNLPVYQSQQVPASPKIIFENEGAYVWEHEDALVISFKTKLGTIGDPVLEALTKARELAEAAYKGLIIWQKGQDYFSAGADLMNFAGKFMLGGAAALEETLTAFQNTILSMRYSKVPVVAAVRGYVLGGGCELAMHSHKVVAHLETYMGLVEVGVGIIPAGCGSKEMALRAAQSQNPAASLLKYFKQIGMAETAKSAYQAKEMGYLRASDVVVMHPDRLLYVAKQELDALAAQPFMPVREEKIAVQGLPAYGNMMGMLTNLQAGHFASDYDAFIVDHLAEVLSGGKIEPQQVDAAWMLALERKAFLTLVQQDKTQARVQHMLETGKPLRN